MCSTLQPAKTPPCFDSTAAPTLVLPWTRADSRATVACSTSCVQYLSAMSSTLSQSRGVVGTEQPVSAGSCETLPVVREGREWTARIGVLTVIEEEFDALRRVLGNLDSTPRPGYLHMRDRPRDVVVKRCADRGTQAAGDEARMMIELFRPEVIIVCGIAGAVENKGLAKGDVVVADYLHYSDFRKIDVGTDEMRYVAYDQPSSTLRDRYAEMERIEPGWHARVDTEPPVETTPQLRIGPVLVGEKVMGDPKHPEVEKALKTFPDAVAVEMESYGVAHAVHRARDDVDYNPLLLVVRGITDLVAEESSGEANSDVRKLWKAYACATAAAVTSELVKRILTIADLSKEPV